MRYTHDELFGYWIKRIYRNMTNLHDKKLAKYGLTTSQVSVLVQLWEKEGQTQKEIQQKLGIRAASLTGILDTLVEKGWIVRKIDHEDARVKRLFVTDAGWELEAASISSVNEMESLLKKGFSPEEVNAILTFLKRIHTNTE